MVHVTLLYFDGCPSWHRQHDRRPTTVFVALPFWFVFRPTAR